MSFHPFSNSLFRALHSLTADDGKFRSADSEWTMEGVRFILVAKAADSRVRWAGQSMCRPQGERAKNVDLTRGLGETGDIVEVFGSPDLTSYGGVTSCYCTTRAGNRSCGSNDPTYMTNDQSEKAKWIESKAK